MSDDSKQMLQKVLIFIGGIIIGLLLISLFNI